MIKVNFLFVSSGLSDKFSGVFFNIWSDNFLESFLENLQASIQIDRGYFFKLFEMQIKSPCQKISSVTIESRLPLLLKKN